MQSRACFLVSAICLAASAVSAQDVGIAAPEGFEVTLYADDDLAHDIFSMTLDARGRVVVAGQGYVKTLHDRDGDGRADEATLFSEIPSSGAHGLVFAGDHLICTGDNSLMRLRDTDGDGRADGEPEVWTHLRHPEHGANGLVHGPDGWFYLICGNDAGVSAEHATEPGSPVSQPQCGAALRFSPDGQRSEILADGFRNPYDLAFNEFGHLFTVDADGERDQHLPWYSPTRLFDIAQGRHHGWVLKGWQRSWNRPPWFYDNVDRLVEIGRGSPTGVAVYRHRQFPQRYRGSVLSCCWTLGRVYCFPLQESGASYESSRSVFLETRGETGFAPVDLAVGPEGDLFVAMGGRRTRGSVFRVSYVGPSGNSGKPQAGDPLDDVLQAQQPLAAWSRARWEPLARQLGPQAFASVCADDTRSESERIRAIEILTEHFGGLSPGVAEAAMNAGGTHCAARVAWSLGRVPQGNEGTALLERLTHSAVPHVARAAWESLLSLPPQALDHADWRSLDHDLRRVRWACLMASARHHTTVRREVRDGLTSAWRGHLFNALDEHSVDRLVEQFRTAATDEGRLQAVRLIELALGDVLAQSTEPDVFAGYSLCGNPQAIAEAGRQHGRTLAQVFPAQQRELNLELARLLGMLPVDDAELVDRMTGVWTADSRVVDDIHYLIVMSQLPAARSARATRSTAAALLGLHDKMLRREQYPSRNWSARVGEAFAELCRRDPHLPLTVIQHPRFGLPDHSMFVKGMPPEHQILAARRLLEVVRNAEDEEEVEWTNELVEVIGRLPSDESMPVLRALWSDTGLRDTLVELFARAPDEQDRGRLVEALSSPQPQVVQRAADALVRLQAETQERELLHVMRALRRFCAAPQYDAVRKALTDLLGSWSPAGIRVDESAAPDLPTAYQPWFDWFAQTYPKSAASLSGLAGSDASAWRDRLLEIAWTQGDAVRGKLVFEARACQRCHLGQSRLGPELNGVTARLSLEDLIAEIVDPNRNVSPLYQTTQLVTGSGKVYHGLIVYESPDGTLVQTSPDETVRIAGDEIVVMRPSNQSLMPVGLLNEIKDGELADLYAYLKTLRGK